MASKEILGQKKEDLATLCADLRSRQLSLQTGKELAQKGTKKLPCGIAAIDNFLEGGLPFGAVTEFGMPLGREGRELLLYFLATATRGKFSKPLWSLWVSSHKELRVYPPAWFAYGVDPGYMLFTETQAPLYDLKSIIVSSFFKLIVLDSPPFLNDEACSFLASQAERNQSILLIVRNYFLSNKRGNVMARLRINCWRNHGSNQLMVKVIRGLSARELKLDEEILPCSSL